MLQWTKQKWYGGGIKVDPETGEKAYYIDRMVRRLRFRIRLEVGNEDEAKVELKLFERDPIAYKKDHEHKLGRLSSDATVIDMDTLQKFVDHCRDTRGLNRVHIKSYVRYLVQWGDTFEGRDLRTISPAQVEDYLHTWSTARRYRISSLKVFCSWLVRKRHVMRAEENPARTLESLKSNIAKSKGKVGYSIEHVERFYSHVRSQDIRDVLLVRAKLGMHHTEIERLISDGNVREIADDRGTGLAAVVTFLHKNKKLHSLSIDAQALAAVKRLQARGFAPSKDWALKMCHLTAKQNNIPMVYPEELRHSFATWMKECGQLVTLSGQGVSDAQIAALMGHSTTAMTHRYIDSAVPEMAKVPINLFHPDDVPIPGLKRTHPKPRLVK